MKILGDTVNILRNHYTMAIVLCRKFDNYTSVGGDNARALTNSGYFTKSISKARLKTNFSCNRY